MQQEGQNNQGSDITQTECRQCGECCRKGGPALHIEDLPLVESGKIPLEALFTIRQGEPAFDNVRMAIAPAVQDIIKIKGGRSRTSICRLYEDQSKHCSQYEDRPAECRALKCWDVDEIRNLYNVRRLTRRHILSKVKGYYELVVDHQERCDYALVAELAEQIRRGNASTTTREELLELIRYDDSLRQVTVERVNIDPEMNDFLFGRPLSFTIQMFKIKYAARTQELVVDPAADPQAELCYRRDGFPTPSSSGS